jgi:hypothetical protein
MSNVRPQSWRSTVKTLPFVDGLHNILLYGATVTTAWAVLATGNAFVTGEHFNILNSELVCQQPLNNRCRTNYSVRDAGSSLARTYEPEGSLFSAGELKTGNEIQKARFSFSYLVNGQAKHWAYGYDILVALLSSIVALTIWYRLTVALK